MNPLEIFGVGTLLHPWNRSVDNGSADIRKLRESVPLTTLYCCRQGRAQRSPVVWRNGPVGQ
jgi:hypothetical protein